MNIVAVLFASPALITRDGWWYAVFCPEIAAVLFALAALGGVTMLVVRLRDAPRPPTWLAVGHGLIALSGLVALGVAYYQTPLPTPAGWALVVFILAALGGASIFVLFHLAERAIPVWIILGHGAVALTGFGLLIAAIYR